MTGGLAMALGGTAAPVSQTAPVAMQVAPAPVALRFDTSGDAAFDAWRAAFAARAVAAGRAPAIVQQVLTGLSPDPRIVTQDQNQAEFVRPVWDYIERAVSARRVSEGQERLAAHRATFTAVEARYGVDPAIIAGIWAIETNFGAADLPYEAPRAIATLAAEGRRRDTFERYLLALIEMVERGYAGPQELRSSWAGALGQPQFMPDVYLQLAVDFDGDGRRDIWANQGDIFASIANYLVSRGGYQRGGPVFDEVRLPIGFDFALADGTSRAIAEWASLGVRIIDGRPLPEAAGGAQLFLPAGYRGPALLLYPNFAAIRSYNPSDRYALAVALLARGFKGEAGLRAAWPRDAGSLDRAQTIALQQALISLNYNPGAADGMFGSNTRRAVRAYQQAKGLPADGYPTPALLTRITNEVGAAERIAAHANSPLLDEAGVIALQRALARAGFAVGRADGQAGRATIAAVKTLEKRLGVPDDGLITQFILAEAEMLPAAPAPRARPARKKRR
jgi:membrane-bound lytic murein transglycosylase B